MRTDRTRANVLRIMTALVFGLMSIVHMPVMAFAGTAFHPAHHLSVGTGHQHHAAAAHHGSDAQHFSHPAHRSAPPLHDDSAICQSTICCAAVAQALVAPPASVLLLIEQLRAPPARVMVPVTPDPVVPPPRLRA